jgi:hypothetical protein
VGTGRKHNEIQKGNYRVEGRRLNQRKQKAASVWKLRTEKTDRIYEENRIISWNMIWIFDGWIFFQNLMFFSKYKDKVIFCYKPNLVQI